MSHASSFQDRYHIQFKGRRTTLTLDKILSQLIAASFGVMPDHKDYHPTVQQWGFLPTKEPKVPQDFVTS